MGRGATPSPCNKREGAGVQCRGRQAGRICPSLFPILVVTVCAFSRANRCRVASLGTSPTEKENQHGRYRRQGLTLLLPRKRDWGGWTTATALDVGGKR